MARVQVLSTPGCPGCAQAKRMVTEVLAEYPSLDWEEIDLTELPELAGQYGIMSVPALLIDGQLEFSQLPKHEVLRARIRELAARGPAQ